MARHVKYKRQRAINPVSITLVLLLIAGSVAGFKYFELYYLKHEAFRVLEEAGSKIAHRPSAYTNGPKATENLRRKMVSELRRIGIGDPDLESWIEFKGGEARIGVVYSVWVEWPYDVIEKQEKTYEVEHVVGLGGGH